MRASILNIASTDAILVVDKKESSSPRHAAVQVSHRSSRWGVRIASISDRLSEMRFKAISFSFSARMNPTDVPPSSSWSSWSSCCAFGDTTSRFHREGCNLKLLLWLLENDSLIYRPSRFFWTMSACSFHPQSLYAFHLSYYVLITERKATHVDPSLPSWMVKNILEDCLSLDNWWVYIYSFLLCVRWACDIGPKRFLKVGYQENRISMNIGVVTMMSRTNLRLNLTTRCPNQLNYLNYASRRPLKSQGQPPEIEPDKYWN
jgi:hypothetical protein